MIHELKTWTQYFHQVKSGLKTFEIRRFDRDYKVGDELLLKEFDNEIGYHTGEICHRKITYLIRGGQFGIHPDYCVMGISKI